MTLYDLFSEVTLYDSVTKIVVVNREGATTDEFMLSDHDKRRQYDNYEVGFIYPLLGYERGISPVALTVIELRDKEDE